MSENNTIHIEKEGLIPVLEAASCIVNKKSPVQSFSNILFTKKGICAINEYCMLEHKIDNEFPFDFGVSTEIFKIVKQHKDDIQFQITDNHLLISSENIKARMNYTEEIETDYLPDIPDTKFETLPLDFITGLKRAKVFADKTENAVTSENFCFIIEGNGIYTTNNKVIIRTEMDRPISPMMFPVDSLNALSALDPDEYCVNDDFVFFRIRETVLIVKQVERTQKAAMIFDLIGKYDDVEEDKKFYIVGDMKKVVDEASIFLSSDNFNDGICFTPEDDRMVLSSKNSRGEIKKDLFSSEDSKVKIDKEFWLSYKFLKPVVGTAEYFIVEDNWVVFFEQGTTTIICKMSV